MIELLKAIKSACVISGLPLYFGIAPQGTATPYCVYSLVSGWPDWTFKEDFENFRIQFSVFDESCSAVNTINYLAAVKLKMDGNLVSVTGFSKTLKFQRSIEQVFQEGDYWHGVVEYEVMLQI